jgi:hypothetical protein
MTGEAVNAFLEVNPLEWIIGGEVKEAFDLNPYIIASAQTATTIEPQSREVDVDLGFGTTIVIAALITLAIWFFFRKRR